MARAGTHPAPAAQPPGKALLMPTPHPLATPPQPSVERIAPVAGRPLIVAVTPEQPDLVVRTAAVWAAALGGVALHCAYVDPTRVLIEEHADGSITHGPLDADGVDDSWRDREAQLRAELEAVLGPAGAAPGSPADTAAQPAWAFHYLAGRADQALTHLARAVGASAYVVGTHRPGFTARAHEFLDSSLATRLTHHQHRPVLVVPLSVVDWHARTPWS